MAEETPLQEINDLVNTFRALAQESPVAAAFGALFAYESQVPRIATEKLAGLKKHYGASDRTCSYFALHTKADVHHSNVWRKIISNLVEQDDRNADEVLDGVSQGASALWKALDGIERERVAQASACVG
jgi:pyrroloquinoline-quinone synthase